MHDGNTARNKGHTNTKNPQETSPHNTLSYWGTAFSSHLVHGKREKRNANTHGKSEAQSENP